MKTREGRSNARSSTLPSVFKFSDSVIRQQTDAYVEKVETIVNASIFGDDINSAQWTCPHADDNGIGPISMENGWMRKIIDNFKLVIDASVNDRDQLRKNKWKEGVTNLRLALKNLCQHQEYKLDDIFQFQLCADVFFQKWIEL